MADREELELLAALTEADARATSEKAWTNWRASLIRTLVRRAAAALSDEPVPDDDNAEIELPDRIQQDPDNVSVIARDPEDGSPDGSRVTVVSRDRIGLLADAAAMLALQRVSRSGPLAPGPRTASGSRCGTSPRPGSTTSCCASASRRSSTSASTPAERLSRVTPVKLEPTVAVRPEASPSATVIEVRSADRPGLIHVVCAALARLDISVRSAHVSTLGPQAVGRVLRAGGLRGRALGGARRLGRARRAAGAGGHLRARDETASARGAATLDDWS